MTEYIIEALDNKGKLRILSITAIDERTAIAFFETEYDWTLENITEHEKRRETRNDIGDWVYSIR